MPTVRYWAPFPCPLVMGLTFSRNVIAQPVWHGPDPVLAAGSTEPPSATIGGPHGVDLIYSGPNGHLYSQWRDAGGGYANGPTDLSDARGSSDCRGPNVTDRISAITVDEVFFIGLKTPIGTISNATMRVWCDS